MTQKNPGPGFALVLGAITLVTPLTIHLFLPAMPEVKREFGASDALIQLTFNISLVAIAFVTLAYGSLSDRYGRRPVLLAGLGLFLLGSVISVTATSLSMLVAGRLVQAIGAGAGLTLTRAIARDAYGPDSLVKAIAYLTMAYTLGPMIAPAFGGFLIDHFGWRSAFWFAIVSGVAIALAAIFVLFETHGAEERHVVPTGVLRNYRALMSDVRFLAFVLQSGFMSFAFFAIAASSPFLMKDLLGRSATEFGLYFMCFPLGYCTGNLVSSRLSGRVGIEKMIMTGSLLCFAIVATQAVIVLSGHLSPILIFATGGLMSFAQGLSLPNAQAGAIRVSPKLAGTAAGLGVFVQMFLSAVSTELYGLFADGTPIPMIVISTLGAALAVGTAVSLYIPRRPVSAPT
jgi:DHA1 family bicyclomycin/chloramphenicol resistance-like MFS transporter